MKYELSTKIKSTKVILQSSANPITRAACLAIRKKWTGFSHTADKGGSFKAALIVYAVICVLRSHYFATANVSEADCLVDKVKAFYKW